MENEVVPVLDKEVEGEYDRDLAELYNQYQESNPDYFIIEQEI